MRIFLALTLSLFLSSCGLLGGASALLGGGGGGPTVNANTQVGKTNNQSAIDQSRDIEAENVQVDESKGSFNLAGSVDSVKVLNQDIPTWVILMMILGWMLPSPIEIWRGFLKTITFGRYRG
jgi:hypothetical protein